MELKEAILCKNYQCVKYGAFTLALSNLVWKWNIIFKSKYKMWIQICSTAGIVLVPYAFVVIYNELHQFYEENNALEQFPVEIKSRFWVLLWWPPYISFASSGHVAILVLALVPLIGNLMSTALLLYSLKTVKYNLKAAVRILAIYWPRRARDCCLPGTGGWWPLSFYLQLFWL